jgi:hypothetical protein
MKMGLENTNLERIQEREESYRMTLARLLDAHKHYPEDMHNALEQARQQLRRRPLWYEIGQEQEQS